MATLKQLVDETTNIKNELVECHTNLKDSLIDKGVEVNSDDKLRDLVNKTNLINGSKYKLNVSINFQIDEPQNPNFGDLWIPIEKDDYKLNFSPINIENPVDKELHLKIANAYVNFEFDNSIDDFMQGISNSFKVNLITNSFDNNISSSFLPILVNGVSKIFAHIGVTRLWDSSQQTWVRVYGKYWSGTQWVGFTSDDLFYYYITSDNKLCCRDFNTDTLLWSSKAMSYKTNKNTITKGQNTIGVYNPNVASGGSAYLYIYDLNGNKISATSLVDTVGTTTYASNTSYSKDGSYIKFHYRGGETTFYKFRESDGEIILKKVIQYSPFESPTTTNTLAIIDDILLVGGSGYLYATDLTLQNDFITLFTSGMYNNIIFSLGDKTPCIVSGLTKNTITIRKLKIDINNQAFTYEDINIPLSNPNYGIGTFAVSLHPETLNEVFFLTMSNDGTRKRYVFDIDGNVFDEFTFSSSQNNPAKHICSLAGGRFVYLIGDYRYYDYTTGGYTYDLMTKTHKKLSFPAYGSCASSSGELGVFNENYGM